MFPAPSNKMLQDVLRGKSILWHPAYWDSGSDFCELQIGMRGRDEEVGLAPEVILLTDDRIESMPTYGTVFELNDNAVIRKIVVKDAFEHSKLLGLQDCLGSVEYNADFKNNLGRVVECHCECDTFDAGVQNVVIIFVAAESVEFLFRVLLPDQIPVGIMYQKNYHRGFNCCQTDGAWLRRAASVLQTEWYYSDSDGLRDWINPDTDKVYRTYPSLLGFQKMDLVSMDINLDTQRRILNGGYVADAQCYKVKRR